MFVTRIKTEKEHGDLPFHWTANNVRFAFS